MQVKNFENLKFFPNQLIFSGSCMMIIFLFYIGPKGSEQPSVGFNTNP